MRYWRICLLVLSSLLFASCASVAALRPTPTPSPEAIPDLGPWEQIEQVEYTQPVYLAGYLNDTFGITVGYGGDARYTTDAGQTWTRAQNVSMCRFGLDIVDEKVAWNCGNGGDVRFTVDGGQTWQEAEDYGPREPRQCRFVSFLDDKTGWVASPYQLGATADGGKTWVDVTLPEGSQDIAAIALRTATDGYLLDTKGTLWVSADGGETWTARSLGLKEGEELVVDKAPTAVLRFIDANRGLAVYTLNNQQIWSAQTTDGGQTWQRAQLTYPPRPYYLYLSHDAQYLTVLYPGKRTIRLLHYKQP